MSEIYLWLAFFGLMLVTIVTRSFFLLGGSRFDIPETVHEFLRYAPTAALIAIVLPEVLFFKDPDSSHAHEADINMLIRICDVHNVPLATNEATAQLLLLGLDEV